MLLKKSGNLLNGWTTAKHLFHTKLNSTFSAMRNSSDLVISLRTKVLFAPWFFKCLKWHHSVNNCEIHLIHKQRFPTAEECKTPKRFIHNLHESVHSILQVKTWFQNRRAKWRRTNAVSIKNTVKHYAEKLHKGFTDYLLQVRAGKERTSRLHYTILT
jgi:hypothetical protein